MLRECSHRYGGRRPPVERKPWLRFGRGLRLWCAWGAAGLLGVLPAPAQTLRLGQFEFTLLGTLEVAYDSNVDEAYPEEQERGAQKGDFYWMPGFSLRSEPVPIWPRTLVNAFGSFAYQDFFVRNDLDTETYEIGLDFQTTHPRLTLGGLLDSKIEVDAEIDVYKPGGASRTQTKTDEANLFANWNYRLVRLEGSADFTRERNYYLKDQADDNDELALMLGAYVDNFHKLSLYSTWEYTDTIYTETDKEEEETVYTTGATFTPFRWGGVYYEWKDTITTTYPGGEEEDDVETKFGLTGDIPLDLFRHPRITFSVGLKYEDATSTAEEDEETWEPVYTLTVADELQLTKTVRLSGNANWDNDVDADEVSFVYNVVLEQAIGPRAKHALTFSQEPERTFGSNSDTENTTYGYGLAINDLIFYGLNLTFDATFEEETPLGEEEARTEETTTYTLNLAHTRKLSRKLSRILAYTYSWENSNFHFEGANERHLLTYGLTYEF